jgi:RNA polymerase sigma-70 factor (ECF subfamily)
MPWHWDDPLVRELSLRSQRRKLYRVNEDDLALIKRIVRGNAAAFATLVERYEQRLFTVAYRVLNHYEAAADATQETFLNIYQALAKFNGESEFSTWAYRIAFNTAISHKRRLKRTQSLDQLQENLGHDIASEATRPGAGLERGEDQHQLQAALAKLSEEHQTVLILKDLEGWKYEEIAELTGLPIGTVRSRIHRARLELRQLIDPSAVGYPSHADPTPSPH